MVARERRSARATRAADRILGSARFELSEARLSAGLSREDVGAQLGWSRTKVARVEGCATGVRLSDIVELGVALGLDPAFRFYPTGDAPRDRAQIALIDRFRARISPAIPFATEVPLPIPGDRRAWDALIRIGHVRIGVEAETRIRDCQAVTRRLQLKVRDGGVDHVILVVARTRVNLDAIQGYRGLLREQLPLDTRPLLAALRDGRDPGASGIVII